MDWEKGKPFLGFQSHPCKWAYAPGDRSQRGVNRTMREIGVAPEAINIIPSWGKDYKSLPQIFEAALKLEAKLLVVEGFAGYADELTSHAVRNFLCAIQRTIEHDNLTVIGVVESPKMKPNERYENPRQRVSGAAAWAHYTETIFLVEPLHVSDPKRPERSLTVCPRNAKGFILRSEFDASGRLVFRRPENG
jgi:hypothetical protein